MKKVHDIDFTNVKIHKILAQAEAQDIDWLPENRNRILERAKNGKILSGLKLPWSKTHDIIRLRGGEVSVWAGYDGHRKSTILCQVAACAAKEAPVGIASFEMELADTAVLMSQQAAGSPDPTMRWHNDFITWSDDRIAIYDRLETVPPEIVFACVYHMVKDLGCKLIVIDSLIMCGIGEDLDDQKAFMNTLSGVAKLHDVHIALVHHMRKPSGGGESQIPSKFDLRGSGAIAAIASSIFLCWADKSKGELLAKQKFNQVLTSEERAHLEDDPDQLLIVAKQRHGDFEGRVSLWHHPSRQFTGQSDRRPVGFDIPRLAPTEQEAT